PASVFTQSLDAHEPARFLDFFPIDSRYWPRFRRNSDAVERGLAASGVAIVVAPFRREHIARVADLHCQTLPGLLAVLGPAGAAAFYAGYLASPRCTAFVEEIDGVLRGFVLGSADPEGMRRDALRANGCGILGGVLARVLRRPGTLRQLAGSAGSLR